MYIHILVESGDHGTRFFDGVAEMRRQMSALYEKNGMPEASDDMNNVFLEPDKVAAARAEEMSFFKKLGRLPTSAARHDRTRRRQTCVSHVARY